MKPSRVLADHLDADANSFNLVRLFAALSVLFSHSYPMVLGAGTAEPLGLSTPYTLGQHAVNVFFVISGLMLTRSLARNPSVIEFSRARILRIFPGLLAFGVVFSFLLGPAMTTWPLSAYLSDGHTYSYPVATLFQFNGSTPPHGIFSATPNGPLVNEPLWTIKYELVAYFVLAGLFVTGMLRRPKDALAFLLLALLGFLLAEILAPYQPDAHTTIHQLVRYGLCFMIGVVAYHFRSWIPTSPVWLLATIAVTYVARGTLFEAPAYFLLAAHCTIVLATMNFGFLTRWARKNDISYGTYVYGWPLQQVLISLSPTLSVAGMMFWSTLIVPVAGWLSWRLIEFPALKFKSAPPKATASSSRADG